MKPDDGLCVGLKCVAEQFEMKWDLCLC